LVMFPPPHAKATTFNHKLGPIGPPAMLAGLFIGALCCVIERYRR